MATLREFILNQSTLPTGNTVREHIKHPGTGGGYLTLADGLEVEMAEACFDVEVQAAEVEVEVQENYDVEIDLTEYIAEVCV